MDMFTLRPNYKVKDYVAWRPDPGATFIDAFCVNWEPYFFYAFPSFSLIPRCLTKIENDKATGVLIIPYWTQSWFTPLLNLLIENPLILSQSDNLLLLPHTWEQHFLGKKLRLIACKLSGQVSCREMFFIKQPKSSCIPGQMPPSSNTSLTSKPGSSCVVNGRLNLMIHL